MSDSSFTGSVESLKHENIRNARDGGRGEGVSGSSLIASSSASACFKLTSKSTGVGSSCATGSPTSASASTSGALASETISSGFFSVLIESSLSSESVISEWGAPSRFPKGRSTFLSRFFWNVSGMLHLSNSFLLAVLSAAELWGMLLGYLFMSWLPTSMYDSSRLERSRSSLVVNRFGRRPPAPSVALGPISVTLLASLRRLMTKKSTTMDNSITRPARLDPTASEREEPTLLSRPTFSRESILRSSNKSDPDSVSISKNAT
mmetsp:Transcript_19774/g.46430  ORF Transcript_19774/g.46430 Transcript_19774/m.46430 type:complete len:263 (-) Transcript_19774:281-1069(-)